MNQTIGVITVVKNGENTIERCMQSVFNQTYKNIEFIIIDGGSTDRTVEIIDMYDSRISYWHSKNDRGIYNALNIGVSVMKSNLYVPLASDDFLYPDAIETFIRNHDDELILMSKVNFEINRSCSQVRNHSAGCMIDKVAHDIFGEYDESYRIAADTKFIGQIKGKNRLKYIDDITGVFNYGGASSNYKKTILEHSRAKYESGEWGAFRKMSWLLPRLIYQAIKINKKPE